MPIRGKRTDKHLNKRLCFFSGSKISFIHKEPDKKQRIITEYKKKISIKKL
jgi:hypothetical protein